MKVALIGAGNMAIEYAKVLNDLKIDFSLFGRNEAKAVNFENYLSKNKMFFGGLDNYKNKLSGYSHAIIASNVNSLAANCIILIEDHVENILVEKPGIATPSEFTTLIEKSKSGRSNIFIAYNRRFFASVEKALELIKEDGGISSFQFDFTEWSHVIEGLDCDPIEKKYLFLANSTHVVDLAFFMGGHPKEISCFNSGNINWHSSGGVFAGSGTTDENKLFSYHANWLAPGRWSVELNTKSYKLILKPMEKLQMQKKGTVAIEDVSIDNSKELNFKPGLYKQTEAFLFGDAEKLCSLDEFSTLFPVYLKIASYT
ncbi:MAG: gfo/Idh/MocA family oxidoreductase [Sphingobacteriaceae bacterium]|nr:gfo/Idh/MocA family oxidoreductase [Sphingobacteriaceae bacterium]